MKDRFIQMSAVKPIQLVVATNAEPCVFPETLTTHIEAGWQKLKQKRHITENATLLRALGYTNETVAVLPDITYREVVGVRHKPHAEPNPFVALTVMAVVMTADNYVVLQKRDSGDWPASYENVGWFVRATQKDQSLDTIILERISTELSCKNTSASLVGVYEANSIAECMFVYLAKVPMSKEELVRKHDVVCVGTPALVRFLQRTPETITLHQPSRKVLQFIAPYL